MTNTSDIFIGHNKLEPKGRGHGVDRRIGIVRKSVRVGRLNTVSQNHNDSCANLVRIHTSNPSEVVAKSTPSVPRIRTNQAVSIGKAQLWTTVSGFESLPP